MLGVKTGTQTWSTAEQRTDFKSDGTRSLSASDVQKHFGGEENVGDVLNRITDPNWVDPAKKMRTAGDSSMDKDAFMGLLLAQMKNQDPTNPLKSHEMAAQLAQFTSLEKLTNISDSIDGLAKAQQPAHNFGALGLIGKAVSGDSSKISRTDLSEIHDVKFRMANDANFAKVTIKDETGEVVRVLEARTLKSGDNEISWNGLKEDGTKANPGQYVASIEATGSNGTKVHAETKFEGVISGVNFTPHGPILMIGKQSVPLSDIKEIIDPRLVQQQKVERLEVNNQVAPGQTGPAQVTPAQAAALTPVVKPESGKAEVGASNIEQVGLSRDMMNQLKKNGVEAGI